MGFKTTKRKIHTAENQTSKHSLEVVRQKDTNKVVNTNIQLLRPNHSIFKKDGNLTIDWEDMTVGLNEDTEELDLEIQYKEWTIVFERLDERMISFINTEMLYRNGDGSFDDQLVYVFPNKNKFFEVEDISGSTFIKKVTVHICYFVSPPLDTGTMEFPYQAKLVVSMINPYDFV